MKRRSKIIRKGDRARRPKASKPQRAPTPKKASRPIFSAAEQDELARLTRERDQALEQQAASAEVLRLISSSWAIFRPSLRQYLRTLLGFVTPNLEYCGCVRATVSVVSRFTKYRMPSPNTSKFSRWYTHLRAAALAFFPRHGRSLTLPTWPRHPLTPNNALPQLLLPSNLGVYGRSSTCPC
jgi:hypothetical protein